MKRSEVEMGMGEMDLREGIGKRGGEEIEDGMIVNLGMGIGRLGGD